MKIKEYLKMIKEYFDNQDVLTEEEEAILEETIKQLDWLLYIAGRSPQ